MLFLFLPLLGFSCSSMGVKMDTCKIIAPKQVTIDCMNGNDYQFLLECNCQVEEVQLFIFNRWGEVLFETDDINYFWDASNEESGTYIWLVKGAYTNGNYFEERGTVTLIK